MTVFKWALLITWLGLLSVFMAYAGLKHSIPLPQTNDLSIAVSPQVLRLFDDQEGWKMVHILAQDCGCSESLAEYLVAEALDRSAIPADVTVRIIQVGDTNDVLRSLHDAGYQTVAWNKEYALRHLPIEGAPWLLIIDSENRIRYSGGYSAQRVSKLVQPEHRFIFAEISSGKTVAPRSGYGCAISKRMITVQDPAGINR